MRYRSAREAAQAQFLRGNRIQPLWKALTRATDALLIHVASQDIPKVTLLAVGGYGRRELFPYSDVDVLLLVPAEADATAGEAIVRTLQQLWDMQIPVSHAVRTVDQAIAAARADHTIAASMMDARFIAGDRAHHLVLKKRLQREVLGSDPHGFVAAKLAERDQRHTKWGDSRFMLEPNIKEGKGGLRDLHTLTWLARYCYRIPQANKLVRDTLLTQAEWRRYRQAYVFFATVRAHLHLLRGRADERLTFDAQTRIAERLKFRGPMLQQKAERFMLRYFQFTREVGSLTRIFCALLEEENMRLPQVPFTTDPPTLPEAFAREAGRLAFATQVDLTAQPTLAVTLFYVAQQTGLDIHPRAHLALARALPTIARKLPFEGTANREFLAILLALKPSDNCLGQMSEMGVLGALIPEFARITGMMQYDGYHTYTVDEHTLVAVTNLVMIESGTWAEAMPLATAAARESIDRAALYVAMLCHDLAKGTGGAHAQKGGALVERIAQRLGLAPASAQLAAWLVAHHLMLSETAFKRDLDDPKTIDDFVALVQTPTQLRLLLILTVADIRAVGPAIWNGWKGALMRDLYQRAMLAMGVGAQDATSPHTVRMELAKAVPEAWRTSAEVLLQQRLPANWWQRPRGEHMASIEAYARWHTAPPAPVVVVTHDAFRDISEVTCCLSYQPHLFRTLSGVMAWIGASIVSARIMVLADGVALATLGIQNLQGHSFAEEHKRLASLGGLIEQGLAGALAFADELPRRRVVSVRREVAIEPSVFFDNHGSTEATVIEITARDRLGLLYDMLGAFEACQLQVTTAHIATYGQKAVDVFYVKDAYGMKLHHPRKREMVQQALFAALVTKGNKTE